MGDWMLDKLKFFNMLPSQLKLMVSAAVAAIFGLLFYGIFEFGRQLGGEKYGVLFGSLAVILAIVIPALIVFAIMGIWKRVRGFRHKRLARQLDEPMAGPVAMGEREKIKSNNDKFRAAVAAMKKDSGHDVYSLPWYIVIGDSGCGKTRLINESGLQFSMGKPEGHQVGTLNYNWWFTEHMIFVDMAGKLCNPRDDADYGEWIAFLGTLAKGRPRCPINGALVCVSVQELLSDDPVRIRENADNMLKRLRELQLKLGVTFPAYLVITKCDLILGFVEFFRGVSKDLLLMNQMAGWSRPGEFSEKYDPETFPANFESLFSRLCSLRLRRLNKDDDTEPMLESAYCFPEEFRELRSPIEQYVSTLFPMRGKSKGVKDVLFRGVYFTSATQEGSLCTARLAKQLGADAARTFESLDGIFDKPQPHFLKDLLVKKVVPEAGLVYKNEAQLVRNQRAKLWLMIGAPLLILLSGVGWWLGKNRLNHLVNEPRDHALRAKSLLDPEQTGGSARVANDEALWLCGKLGADAVALRGDLGFVRLFSLGAGNAPDVDLRRIQAGVYELGVMRAVAEDAGEQLAGSQIKDADGKNRLVESAAAYGLLSAASRSEFMPKCIDEKTLEKLDKLTGSRSTNWSIAADATGFDTHGRLPSSSGAASQPLSAAPGASANDGVITLRAQRSEYFKWRSAAASSERPGNPAWMFRNSAPLDSALKSVEAYYLPWAKLDQFADAKEKSVLEKAVLLIRTLSTWMGGYAKLLDLEKSGVGASAEADTTLRQTLGSNLDALIPDEWSKLGKLADSTAPDDLWPLLCDHRNQSWKRDFDLIAKDAKDCAELSAPRVGPRIDKLDMELATTLKRLGLSNADRLGLKDSETLDTFLSPEKGEPPPAFAEPNKSHEYALAKAKPPSKYELTAQAEQIRKELERLRGLLKGGATQAPQTIPEWNARLAAHNQLLRDMSSARTAKSDLSSDLHERWKRDKLQSLASEIDKLQTHALSGALLAELSKQLTSVSNASDDSWGIATLFSECATAPADTAFVITAPERSAGATSSATPNSAKRGLSNAARNAWLFDRAIDLGTLLFELNAMQNLVASNNKTSATVEECRKLADQSWRAYASRYAAAWNDAATKQWSWKAPAQQDWAGLSAAIDAMESDESLKKSTNELFENVAFVGFGNARPKWAFLRKISSAASDENREKYKLVQSLGVALGEVADRALAGMCVSDAVAEDGRVESEFWTRVAELRKQVAAANALLKTPGSASSLPKDNVFKVFSRSQTLPKKLPPVSAMIAIEDKLCGAFADAASKRIDDALQSAGTGRERCEKLKQNDAWYKALVEVAGTCGSTFSHAGWQSAVNCCAKADPTKMANIQLSFTTGIPQGGGTHVGDVYENFQFEGSSSKWKLTEVSPDNPIRVRLIDFNGVKAICSGLRSARDAAFANAPQTTTCIKAGGELLDELIRTGQSGAGPIVLSLQFGAGGKTLSLPLKVTIMNGSVDDIKALRECGQ